MNGTIDIVLEILKFLILGLLLIILRTNVFQKLSGNLQEATKSLVKSSVMLQMKSMKICINYYVEKKSQLI